MTRKVNSCFVSVYGQSFSKSISCVLFFLNQSSGIRGSFFLSRTYLIPARPILFLNSPGIAGAHIPGRGRKRNLSIKTAHDEEQAKYEIVQDKAGL